MNRSEWSVISWGRRFPVVDSLQWSTRNVSALMVCLNDQATIRRSLQSLETNNVGQIVVVDGGSTDSTLEEMQDLPVLLIRSLPGIRTQIMAGNQAVSQPFVLLGEADQIYERSFVSSLLQELVDSGFEGIQARKTFSRPQSFLEKGHALFLRIHQGTPGPRDMISGPALWKTDDFRRLVLATGASEGYSFDTELGESVQRLGFQVGTGSTPTEEITHINLRSFLRRLDNYGKGDFIFFSSNRSHWNLARKMFSLTHIFRRYGVDYPLRSLREGHPFVGVPYFWLVCVLRYFFWFRAWQKDFS